MSNEIERKAALALLHRGVGFELPAPWFYRLWGRKKMTVTVKQIYLGTLVHLSSISDFELEATPHAASPDHKQVIEEMGGEPKSLPLKTIIENRKIVTQAVAACLLNSRIKTFLFQNILARHLMHSATVEQLQELLMWIFIYGRAESFTITTKLLRKMTMMKPRNLGQM